MGLLSYAFFKLSRPKAKLLTYRNYQYMLYFIKENEDYYKDFSLERIAESKENEEKLIRYARENPGFKAYLNRLQINIDVLDTIYNDIADEGYKYVATCALVDLKVLQRLMELTSMDYSNEDICYQLAVELGQYKE